MEEFTARISNYFPVSWTLIPPLTGKEDPERIRQKECAAIEKLLKKEHELILLDERGKLFDSRSLASLLGQRAASGGRELVFLIGGAFGVTAALRERAQFCWSLSPLTFPHQLVRLILAEQIYRACSILRNEKYHHD